MTTAVRTARPEDEEFILALNAACDPAVSPMSAEDFRDISGWAHATLVAEVDGARAGFVILIRPGTAYPSDNYGWFERRFERFLYVDRIAVADGVRGKGVGRALYDAAAEMGRGLYAERLTCEVNEDPPNPESMAFHACEGFLFLASRKSKSGKQVAMLARELV